ncbi:MAG: tRNA dimethylallyltransferase [Gaiellales bacterium]|jgi:tRNA dimethylallyltransferase|nr:tRNA dimethylallyltransferase [Gaiellales bacterium]
MSASVVAVFGPTASGKSAAALRVAEAIGGEIVSCDAMQLYQDLPILTNQPAEAELRRVPHHLIGMWPLSHEGSVAEYGELARDAIDAVLGRGKPAVVCGGSGLYLRAALAPFEPPPQPAEGARERLEQLYDEQGAAAAHRLLAQRDARAAAAVHRNDRRRVVRALELAEQGHSLAPAESTLWTSAYRRPTRVFGIELSADTVRERIAARTRSMFENGVVDEVRRAREAGPFSSTAARIHGLQDVSALLDGVIDEEEATRRLDTRTRQYAKRQRAWMRRLPGVHPVSSVKEMLEAAAA